MLIAALIAATFVSEDLACISAGLLVRHGRISFVPAAAACAAGILIGDIGLWATGRISRRAFSRWPAVSRYIDRLPVREMRQWLDDHAALALLASRFMPGTRLALYLCAGTLGMSFRRFTT